VHISIIGTNGMLSAFLSDYFFAKENTVVDVYGITPPDDYNYSDYHYLDLLADEIDYDVFMKSDLVIYAAGAGVQASVGTSSELMYKLNLLAPVTLCYNLKRISYTGKYISFGSYMELGINDDENINFTEEQIELSKEPISNDYSSSKSLYTRFIGRFLADFSYCHFILPNTFVRNEKGTRLIPYILNYISKVQNGEQCDMPRFSSGNQIRQYISLYDLGKVISLCTEKTIPSGIYNVGGGEVLTIKELITRIFHFYHVEMDEKMFGQETRRDGDIRSLKLDGSKLYKEIGYLPALKIESIL
jgi:nucleoside-diphosphate-sugar epimerase